MSPTEYLLARHIHMSCAGISIGLFTLRGGLQLAGLNWRRWRLLRSLPHVNDTVLLCAAIALAWQSQQYPIAQNWLTAKVVALVVYVGLGSVALRPRAAPLLARWSFAAALATVGYIVWVARTRSATLGLF